ncbi:Xaa-Pro aminopeptidase [Ventosimonas gracilis]|uniref:Xaa-Pro aminopeptidase n=1 Tax=Ventosimonas gracilis TaxID=1680762 RepID=A0A139SH92_9GAMM|nr:Xaa-Pro aminopeptidase [Ventosimonas gracilis]KXU33938.1 Xaa-Pro aminopeptidase [Ventosimonas gracilis]
MIKLPQTEYARRREALMAQMLPNSIAILPAAPVQMRNADVEHIYRQNSDFQYLTGFGEPEALLVLLPGRAQGQYLLFCRKRDPAREIWDGKRAGIEGAVRDYGADEAFAIDDIDELLPSLMQGCERVYCAIGHQAEFDSQLFDWVKKIRAGARQGAHPPHEYIALEPLLHDMRLRKSPQEIRLMRAAAELSCRAHIRAMQASRAGLYEYHLEAELDYEFRKGGAKMPAYGSIVAAGAGACTLHYRDNDAPLVDGELVLIDAGCELDCYASDITRTFPVNGRFSREQKAIYELVLKANEAAIACVAPGRHFNEAHETTVRVITEGLIELGLLQGALNELIENEAYRAFYMHRAGHWLGMDVHDVGDYKTAGHWRTLEPGMCLTIEPGIYIAPDNMDVPEQWRGIGVRIEDDIVVTENGCEVLTTGVPKQIDAIEALMAAEQRD